MGEMTRERDWAVDAAEDAMLFCETPVLAQDGTLVIDQTDQMYLLADRIRSHAHPRPAVPDGYEPTDDEVRAWMERNDIPDSYVDQWRVAIDDARSMHMLSAAPESGGG